MQGFVNGVEVGPRARFCVVAVGQEPRLGRWDRVPKAKNRFGIVKLRPLESAESSDEEFDQDHLQKTLDRIQAEKIALEKHLECIKASSSLFKNDGFESQSRPKSAKYRVVLKTSLAEQLQDKSRSWKHSA